MLDKLLDRFREKGPSRPRSKMEAEKRRRLFIVLVIVVAVVTAVSLVGYGYYATSIRPWNQRILKVNGTVFDMRDFVKVLRLNGANSADYAEYVISIMQDNEISRQRLKDDFGIVITDDAVEAKLPEHLVMYGFVSDNSTDEEFQEGLKRFKKALKDSLGFSLKDYEKLAIEPQLIGEELKKQIGEKDYPEGSAVEHAQVQALLVSGADDAAQLRVRWEAGEAFDILAEEKAVTESIGEIDSDNTSTIEWVAMGTKDAAFDGYAFAEVWSSGVISDPIQQSDGTGSYWLINVVARESRTLGEGDRETLAGEAYSQWLEEALDPENNDVVNYLDEKGGMAKLNWALDHVTVGAG